MDFWIRPSSGVVAIDDASISGIDCSSIPSNVQTVFWYGAKQSGDPSSGEILYNDRVAVREPFTDPSPYLPLINNWMLAAAGRLFGASPPHQVVKTSLPPQLSPAQAIAIKGGLLDALFAVKRQAPLNWGMRFSDYGSYGLRQFGGWVREEFLPELTGRNGARVYREMLDNSATVGSMIFAVQQAMRGVRWRVEPANDSPEAEKEAEFVDSLRDDMSHTWDSFITEALSMLGYGYSIHEIVYKRRLGQKPEARSNGSAIADENPSSKFDDGRIGWRRLPIRGQDVVLKWFFDQNGQIRGVTQQPWVGTLIDIPIEKMLLFRPLMHKNNPEGRSVLRNAYRPYYFTKRLEEMEAILIERMSGFPVLYVPTSLLDAANTPIAPGGTPSPQQAQAMQTLQGY
jgi:hypothetical protein